MDVIKDVNKRKKKIKRTQITQRKNDSDYLTQYVDIFQSNLVLENNFRIH